MAKTLFLCRLDDLSDPGSRGFSREADGVPLDCFVVRKNGRVHGYRNRCPHTGVSLDWVPDRFLDMEGGFIQCATHGALFRIEDGMCIRGPCSGESLEPVRVRVSGERVVLQEPAGGT